MRERRVYFARCIGPHKTPIGAIKIGCSFGHEDRLAAIGRNQPFTLELITTVPGEMITEAMIHLYLRRHRIGGEFFHENQVVMRFIEAAAERGRAFYYIDDVGAADNLPKEAIEAFMAFHGITIRDVCAHLERDPKAYENKLSGSKNRMIIAATAILAQMDQRFVSWPRDCILGLLGQVHYNVAPTLPAPETVRAA